MAGSLAIAWGRATSVEFDPDVLDSCKRTKWLKIGAADITFWGDSSVMGLSALHRHCRLPATAAALLSVLLYTALVASHVVSQATPRVLIGAQGATAQAVDAGDAGCHELLPSAGNTNDANRGLPAPPQRNVRSAPDMRFCTSPLPAACVDVLSDEASAQQFDRPGQTLS